MAELVLENFKKSFGSKVVHRNVSLRLEKGKCLGLIGGSGAGKSIILRSFIGLETPDSGKVLVREENVPELSEAELIEVRKSVAYVFQGGALFDSMSVFENIAYPLREQTNDSEETISKKVLGILEDFGLEGNESLYPADLSGGMQKRLGLARAIILEPSIVLYDEPTAGLDPYNTRKIQEMILKLKDRGVTSILVTHDMPSAFAVCDEFAILINGEIKKQEPVQGSPLEIDYVKKFAEGHDPKEIQ